jgi:hypothetical protein
MRLYDYPGEYFALQTLVAEATVDPEGNPLELNEYTRAALNAMVDEFQKDFTGKVERTMQYRANLQAEIDEFTAQAETFEREAKRLKAQATGRGTKIKALTYLVHATMEMIGITKMNAGSFGVSIVKNPPSMVVSDESKVPPEFFDVVPQSLALNNAKLKEALKEREVPGARLVQGSRLAVK